MSTDHIKTAVATLAFPQVHEAKADDRGTLKFSAVLLFPKATTNLDALKKIIIQARDEQWPDPNKRPEGLKLGIRDGDKPNGNGNIPNGYAGHWTVNVATKLTPQLVDENVRPVSVQAAREKFYPGCKVIANVNAFSYTGKGNQGVSVGFNALQWVGHGEKLAQSVDVSSTFSPVPGSAAASASGNGDSLNDFAKATPEKDPFG